MSLLPWPAEGRPAGHGALSREKPRRRTYRASSRLHESMSARNPLLRGVVCGILLELIMFWLLGGALLHVLD